MKSAPLKYNPLVSTESNFTFTKIIWQIKMKTANIWEYKVGKNDNFVCENSIRRFSRPYSTKLNVKEILMVYSDRA